MDTHKLIEDLKTDEAFVGHAYKDDRGYWTIGIGRLIDEKMGGQITLEEAEFLLANDIQRVICELVARLPWFCELSEGQQRGLINMNFNLGITKFMKFKKMLAAFEIKDYHTAADEALDSTWAGQVGDRAQRIAALIRQP